MGSNRGNNPKHAPGYQCYKKGSGKSKKDKVKETKKIAEGKKRKAAELAQLSGR